MEDVCREIAEVVDSCPLQVPEDVIPGDLLGGVKRYRRKEAMYAMGMKEYEEKFEKIEAIKKHIKTLEQVQRVKTVIDDVDKAVLARPISEVVPLIHKGHSLLDGIDGDMGVDKNELEAQLKQHEGHLVSRLLAGAACDSVWRVFDEEWVQHSTDHWVHPLKESFYDAQVLQYLTSYRNKLQAPSMWASDVSTVNVRYTSQRDATDMLRNPHVFPKCKVTVSVSQLAILLYDLVSVEGDEHTTRTQDLAMRLFELYCAIMPLHQKSASSAVGLLLYCDSLFMEMHAALIQTMLPAACKEDFDRLAPLLGRLSKASLASVVDVQVEEVQRELATVGEALESHKEDRLSTVSTGLSRLMQQLKQVNQLWRSILPIETFRECLGTLSEIVLSWCCDTTVAMQDIDKDECECLVEHFSYFQFFEGWFVDASELDLTSRAEAEAKRISQEYLPSRNRFESLLGILTAPTMAGIMEMVRSDTISPITPEELASLIRALYAPSKLRNANLDEILGN